VDSKKRDDLRQNLIKFHQKIEEEINKKKKEHRDQTERRRSLDNETRSSGIESSDFGICEDVEFSLIEKKTELLKKINEAILRLDSGIYGECSQCQEQISEKRLKALPFAIRCKDCEEKIEEN